MDKNNPIMKTKSDLWTSPNARFFRYLKMIEKTGLPKEICILGCSDGNYVLPAARRGFLVTAVDIDEVAIEGGYAKIGNKKIMVEGLKNRIKKHNLQVPVEVIKGNFMDLLSDKTFSGVFSSGLMHYSQNNEYGIEKMINKMKSLVSVGGILLIEHIVKENTDGYSRYISPGDLNRFFGQDWFIKSHKTKKYYEAPNPRNPNYHNIIWARLYAIRKAKND